MEIINNVLPINIIVTEFESRTYDIRLHSKLFIFFKY